MKTIGDAIKELRIHHGLSEMQLAKRIGVSRPVIKLIEKDDLTRYRERKIPIIAKEFGLTMGMLYALTIDPKDAIKGSETEASLFLESMRMVFEKIFYRPMPKREVRKKTSANKKKKKKTVTKQIDHVQEYNKKVVSNARRAYNKQQKKNSI